MRRRKRHTPEQTVRQSRASQSCGGQCQLAAEDTTATKAEHQRKRRCRQPSLKIRLGRRLSGKPCSVNTLRRARPGYLDGPAVAVYSCAVSVCDAGLRPAPTFSRLLLIWLCWTVTSNRRLTRWPLFGPSHYVPRGQHADCNPDK